MVSFVLCKLGTLPIATSPGTTLSRCLIRNWSTKHTYIQPKLTLVSVLPFFTDVNECLTGAHLCDPNANCTNTQGSHLCTCRTGYNGDGKHCQGESILPGSVRLFPIVYSAQPPGQEKLYKTRSHTDCFFFFFFFFVQHIKFHHSTVPEDQQEVVKLEVAQKKNGQPCLPLGSIQTAGFYWVL